MPNTPEPNTPETEETTLFGPLVLTRKRSNPADLEYSLDIKNGIKNGLGMFVKKDSNLYKEAIRFTQCDDIKQILTNLISLLCKGGATAYEIANYLMLSGMLNDDYINNEIKKRRQQLIDVLTAEEEPNHAPRP